METMTHTPHGQHVLIELGGCPAQRLDDREQVQACMEEAARQLGATIVEVVFHRFAPQGISGVVVIAESHLTIHTWPEHGYAAVDLFTCGAALNTEAACQALQRGLSAQRIAVVTLQRGPPRP